MFSQLSFKPRLSSLRKTLNQKGFAMLGVLMFTMAIPAAVLVATELGRVVRDAERTTKSAHTKQNISMIRDYLIGSAKDIDGNGQPDLYKEDGTGADATIPLSVPITPVDMFGTPYLYCTWHLGGGNQTNSMYSQNNATPPKAGLIGKIISAGYDKTFQTGCQDVNSNGDDIVTEIFNTSVTTANTGWTSGGGKVFVTSLTDYVGLGTNAPTSRLTLYDSTGTTDASEQIRIGAAAGQDYTIGRVTATGLLKFSGTESTAGYEFQTGGVDRLVVTNNGNVGIGNSSPDALLTLGANTGPPGYIRLRGTGVAEGNIYHDAVYSLRFDTGGNASPIRIDGSRLDVGAAGGVNLLAGPLQINGTTVIDASRNLSNIAGVASNLSPTTSGGYNLGAPAAQWGTIYAVNMLQNGQQVIAGGGNAGSIPKFTSANLLGNSQIMDDGTNVSIGNSSPLALNKLYVKGSTSDSTTNVLNLANSAGTGILVVRNDGNVGVGTSTNLSSKLTVTNGTGSNTEFSLGQSDSNASDILVYGGGSGFLSMSRYSDGTGRINNTGSMWGTQLLLDASGNVGIGTNSFGTARLVVNGNLGLSGSSGTVYAPYFPSTGSHTGALVMQAGFGSAAAGGAVTLYGSSNATKPGWVTAGISQGAGSGATEGRFTVNDSALGGGTDVFTVLRTGYVGIGTTAPVSPLETISNVNWASSWRQGITSTSNDYPTIRLRSLGSGKVSFIGNDNDGGLWFGVNGSDSAYGQYGMVILPSGRVGIATTSPTSMLDVRRPDNTDGDAVSFGSQSYYMGRLGEDVSSNKIYIANTYNNDSSGIDFRLKGTGAANSKMFIRGDGNVGIGNVSPGEKLTVSGGNISVTSGNLHTNRGRVAFSSTASDPNHSIYNDYNNLDGEGSWDGMKMNVYAGLNIRVGNASGATPTSALYINGSGQVGLGTTSPAGLLHLKGTGVNILTMENNNTGAYGLLQFLENGVGKGYLGMGGSAQAFGANAAYSQDGMSFNSDGSGVMNISNRGASRTIYLNTGTEGAADFHTVTVKSGNLGLGTVNPTVKLDVNGVINVFDAGSKGLYAGLSTEAGANLINFGLNDESSNRFGGAYSSAAQGGFLRVDARGGTNLFTFFGRNAASTAPVTPLMSINSAGNVGISTTSPDANLQVAGHVHVGNQTAWSNPGSWNKTITLDGAIHSRYRALGSAYASGKNSATEADLWVDNSNGPSYAGVASNAGLAFNVGGGYNFAFNGGSVVIGGGGPSYMLDVRGTAGFQSYLYGNDKIVAATYDSYLRLNESSQFSNGIWVGTSDLKLYTGHLYVGGSGGAGGEVDISGTSADSVNRITINGNAGANSWFNTGGNFGIGTAGPSQKLSVAGNALIGTEGSTRILVVGGGGPNAVSEYYSSEANPRWSIGRDLVAGGLSGMGFAWPGSSIAAGGSAVGIPAPQALGLYVSNGSALTERARVTNLGINLPAAEQKYLQWDYSSWTDNIDIHLHNTFDMHLRAHGGFYFFNNHLNVGEASNTGFISNSAVWFSPRSVASDFYITPAGNVGIGTSAAAYKLDIAGNMRVASGDNSYTYYGPNASWGGQLYVGASPSRATANTAQVIATDGNLHLDSGTNSKAMYIQYYSGQNTFINPGTGSVGVGTTSPSYKLHVVGDTYTTGWFRTPANTGWMSDYGGGWFMQDTAWVRTVSDKNVWTGAGLLGGNGGLTVGYGGNGPPSGGAIIAGAVGIGTMSPTAGAKLHIVGGGQIIETTGSGTSTLLAVIPTGTAVQSLGAYPGNWTSAIQIQADGGRYLWMSPLYSNSGANSRIASSNGLDFYVNGQNTTKALALDTSGNATVAGSLTAGGYIRSGGNIYTDANYGYGLVGVYDSYHLQGVFSMGSSWALAADGTGPGNLYGLAWSHPNAGGVAANLNNHGLMVLVNGGWVASLTGSIRARDDMRAPIFYDLNDPSYYLDPNGTSNLNHITASTSAHWGLHTRYTDRSVYTSDTNYWTGTNGWSTAEGTFADAWRFGFGGLDIWGSGSDHPQSGQGYVHAQGIQSGIHMSTADGGTAYGWQMVGAHAATENRWWLRGKWGGGTAGWVEMLTTGNAPYAYNMNQYVRTTDSPTFANLTVSGSVTATEFYSNSWFRSNSTLTGLYNQADASHFYHGGGYWNMASNSSTGGLRFRDQHESTVRGYVYHDTSGFGLLNNVGSWVLRNPTGSQDLVTYGTLILGGNTITTTNSGLVSNLNADLLDGYHASQLQGYQSNRDFGSGTLVQSDIDYSQTYGEPFLLEISGNSYGGGLPWDIKAQGYIYANTIINYGATSTGTNISGLIAMNYGGKLCFWWPRQGYWQGFTVSINDSYAGVKRNRLVSISDSALPSHTKEVAFNPVQALRTDNAPYAANMNQYVRITDSPTFSALTVSNGINAYSYTGNGNVGGTGAASWHPSGIYSAGHNWLYGGASFAGGTLDGIGTLTASTGNVTTINATNLYLAGSPAYLYGDGNGVRSSGNFLANGNIYWGSNGIWLDSWLNQAVRTDSSPTFGALTVNGPIYTYGARNSSIIGSYDPTHLAQIWSMGASYQLTSDGFAGNLYGLSYSYEPGYGYGGANPGAISGLGHQMQWRSNGATQTAIGSGIWTIGNITPSSGAGGYLYGDGNGVHTSGNFFANADIYLGTRGTWLSSWLNQAVRTDSNPTFAGMNVTGAGYFYSNRGAGSYSANYSSPGMMAYSTDGGTAFLSFHRGGYYAVNMGLDPDNVLRIGGWSAAANRWQLDMSGNNWVAGSLHAGGNLYVSGDAGGYIYGDGNGIRTSGNFLANGNIYWGTKGVWLDSWMNQAVRTDSSPTFTAVTATNFYGRSTTSGYAETAPWGGISGKPSYLMYYQGFTLDANTMDANASGFTYSVNAPWTGPIARLSEPAYSLEFNAQYGGSGQGISFRTRNGDTGSWNPWYVMLHSGNASYAYNMNQYVRTTDSPTFAGTHTALKAASGMAGYGGDTWVSDFQNTPTSSFTFGEDHSSGGPRGTWWFQQNMRHANGGNYWGTQVAWGWEDNANELWTRNICANSWSGWVRYLNSSNSPYAYNMDQYVRSTDSPTFSNLTVSGNITGNEVYTNSWLRNNSGTAGLYNQVNQTHLYSSPNYWKMSGGYSNGSGGLQFYQGYESNLRGYVYWDTASFGLLDNAGSWRIRLGNNGGNASHTYGAMTVSGSGGSWSGMAFEQANGTYAGTLMMNGGASGGNVGFYDENRGYWRLQIGSNGQLWTDNGTLNAVNGIYGALYN